MTVEWVSLHEIEANAANFRLHADSQLDAIDRSLKEFGWLEPLVWNRATGRLISGHARLQIARRKREESVPCVVVEFSDQQELEALATLGRVGDLATYDENAVVGLLQQLQESRPGDPLGQIAPGWDNGDLDRFLADLAAEQRREGRAAAGSSHRDIVDNLGDEVDELPPEAATPKRVRKGDLWTLGTHILICGDCTNREDVARLQAAMGGKAWVILADPPYGVDYHAKAESLHKLGCGHSATGRNDDISRDNLSPVEIEAVWRSAYRWAMEVVAQEGAAYYGWSASGRLGTAFARVWQELGLLHHQTLVWLKEHFVIGRCDYMNIWEPCLYGWRQGSRPPFYGEKGQTTCIRASRDRGALHSAQKPVEVLLPMILNHTKLDQWVYDPFGGSGSTLIACEGSRRRCGMLEWSPANCDIVLARWEAYTGELAEQVEDEDRDGDA